MSKLFVQGVENLEEDIKDVFLRATNNLEWLKEGDLVLLKPAINSPDPYPATTSPVGIRVVKKILEERGAKVIVGDQSGIEHVVCGPEGIVKGDSEKCFIDAGNEGEFKSFEKDGWDGFNHFTEAPSWENGFYYTKWVDEVDHIISLPRLSTHAQAGVTLGFKNMVGILREDSRMEFHQEGPFNAAFKVYAKQAGMKGGKIVDRKFFEKMTEISLAIKDKLRLTLVVGTKAQVTFGPDAKVMQTFKSRQVELEEGVVFASDDQVAAEVYGIALLKDLYSQLKLRNKLLQKLLVNFNGQIKELDKQDPWENPFVKHGLKIGLGKKDLKIIYKNYGREKRHLLS